MIPFNKPYFTGYELSYIKQAYTNGHLSGDGTFTDLCSSWLEKTLNVKKALLTHSCTAALEMAAILLDIKPGDEIIMPSYTFVSTANAFVLRGGVPVFVDIRPDTLNIDENLIENAITSRTKAIVPVHYAGVACEMEVILDIAKRYNLMVVEDAAQAIGSSYKGQMLGSIGHLGCLSFHETKNVISGEGGALLINDKRLIDRAEIIREKGTNRSKFFRGQVDKYTWIDIGSSYLPSEITAAFLWAQLQEFEDIIAKRKKLFNYYNDCLKKIKNTQVLFGPSVPDDCHHNSHLLYILLSDNQSRTTFLRKMNDSGIGCTFHYVPLHSSPAGSIFGKANGKLEVTNDISERLVRLPLYPGMSIAEVDLVVSYISDFLTTK
ncbi:dTDP-4-amino-4,6-dideoxygalactose transaminase [Candidatus Pseudothioglobus sp. Uisw_086]|uniref:dTDP-4-amino-4,6-dideoxygalactose transaminase n=1 Tax=Candidatus Pseudothioglobus sp. Uisw_086 TaxID=3230998 RepID=UPI003A85E2C8